MNRKLTVNFIYDGECPLCQIGASLYKLHQSVGRLNTVDARTEHDHPMMCEVNDAGLDLDEGMVIKYQDKLFQGGEALHIMAQLGADAGVFNKLNSTFFKSQRFAKLFYPFMRTARNLALAIKHAEKIGYYWRIFGMLIPTSLTLLFGKSGVWEEAIDDNGFRMYMSIAHPLFGQTFLYRGQFKVV